MDLTLFWTCFVIFGLVYFVVAILASKNVTSEEDYFLGNRHYGVLAVTLTLVATQLGAGMVLGASDEAYRVGLYGLFYNIGICVGFLILSMGVAGKLRGLNITTTAELFETKYGSVVLRRCASLLSIITLGGILSGQILASRKLISTFYPDGNAILIGFWLLVITYTMFGGIRAVIATDILQVILIFVIFGGTFALIAHTDGSVLDVPAWLIQHQPHFSAASDNYSLYGFLFMPVLFSFIEQDLAQRFFAARTKRIAVLGAFFAAIIILVFSLIPVYLGMKANSLGLSLEQGGHPLLLVVQVLSSQFVLVLVVCALIAAISSTADSLLCAISSNIVSDFSLAVISKEDSSASILTSRLVTFVVGASALIGAYFFNNILGVLIQSYEISVSCLFIPTVFCLLRKQVYKEAAACAFAAGLFGFFFFRVVPIPLPRELMSLALSLAAFLIAHAVMRQKSQ